MIAKAETLQASIGVSCNEEDLQDCHADVAAASGNKEGSVNAPSLLATTQGHTTTTRQDETIVAGQSDDPQEAAMEADKAAAVESPVRQALLDKPFR